MKFSDLLTCILHAENAEDLDCRFSQLQCWHELKPRTRDRLARAVTQRGWEIVKAHPLGRLVPEWEKRYGFRVSLDSRKENFGSWGNGPGRRYVIEHARSWCAADLVEKGVPEKVARDEVFDWSLMGFPHRALLAVCRHVREAV